MIRIWSIIVVALFCVNEVAASDVQVRTGEHGSFTRVVFDNPKSSEFSVSQPEANQIEVIFSNDNYSVNLDSVFDRIDRSRIESFSTMAESKGVEIALSCNCTFDTFVFGNSMLVLDIRESLAQTDTDSTPAVNVKEEIETGENLATKSTNTINQGNSFGVGNLEIPIRKTTSTPKFMKEAIRLKTENLSRDLSRQLARVATQGILNPLTGSAKKPIAGDQKDIFAQGTQKSTHSIPASLSGRLTSMLSNGSAENPESRIRVGGTDCLSDEKLSVSDWASDAALTVEIPQLRHQLYAEFDRIDLVVRDRLAKAFIRLGFGAEARATLDLDPDLVEPILLTLAEIVDGGIDRAGSLAGQSGCNGPVALWAVIGSQSLPDQANIHVAAVLRAFEDLPITLRKILGPRLADRLAEEGEINAAESVLRRLERTVGENDEAIQFSEAKIERLRGVVAEASSVLEEIAKGRSEYAPAAVSQAIAISRENGSPVSPDLTSLSGAYATEFRNSNSGEQLWLAHQRALAANGKFAQALDAIEDTENISREVLQTAAYDVMELLVASQNETDFLKYAISPPEQLSAPSDSLVNSYARRLLNLGFPEEAEKWLEHGPVERSRETRLLSARAYLALSQPRDAEVSLIGLTGNDVLALRAAARAMMGDHEFASSTFRDLGETDQARRSAWLSGDWASVAQEPQDSLGSAAQLVDTNFADIGSGRPSLQMAEALIGLSEDTLSTIDAMLDETDISRE